MAVVATAPLITSSHTNENDANSDDSPSGFTAVNGREPLLNGANELGESPRTSDSTIRVSMSHREDQNNNHTSNRQASPPHQEHNRSELSNGDYRRIYQHHPPYQVATSDHGSHKRKRSQTDDSSSSISHESHSPPQHTQRSSAHVVGRNIHPDLAAQRQFSHDAERPAHSQYSIMHNGGVAQTHGHGNPWHDRAALSQTYQINGSRADSSDAQLAEVLQQDVHGQDSTERHWVGMDRSEEDQADPDDQRYGSYEQERTSRDGSNAGPKRKRVFSNRTKTGCMTCRRRKKKCDEKHPSCNNCLRGGFNCEGYNVRQTWQKPSIAKGHVPLQAKDGYGDVTDQPYPTEEVSPRSKRSSIHQEGMKSRPILVDDVDQAHAQFMTSPTSAGPRSRGSYPPQWSNSTNLAYLPEHTPNKDYLPSFSEITRSEAGKPEYGGMAPMRGHLNNNSHSIPSASVPSAWQGHPNMEYRHGSYSSSHANINNPQTTARMALSIEQEQSSTGTFSNPEAEKMKMMRGQSFRFMDPMLSEERERCRNALWRFNNAGNPVFGISEKERFRLLQEILHPPKHVLGPETPHSHHKFRYIGEACPGSVVETPFRCHYGYNIKLGEDVYIGENCMIIDACPVRIGSKTWIGPNVTIITAQAETDMVHRQGAGSLWKGRDVLIEEEVWIGAGVTIYPGVTLKRGSRVDPGSVVTKHWEQNEHSAYGSGIAVHS